MEECTITEDGYVLNTADNPHKKITCPDHDIQAECTDPEKGEVEITLLKGRFVNRK